MNTRQSAFTIIAPLGAEESPDVVAGLIEDLDRFSPNSLRLRGQNLRRFRRSTS
jgi:hypothetical protein